MTAISVPIFEKHSACAGCGYDLFGQPRGGVCPECGGKVGELDVARLKSATFLLLVSSIFAGLCPGVCFLFIATGAGDEGGAPAIALAGLISLVFAVTVYTAARGERQLASVGAGSVETRSWFAADIVAGVGLLMINAAAYANLGPEFVTIHNYNGVVVTLVFAGFLCLALTAWRAVPAYRLRARVADAAFARSHRGLIALGWVKAVYETAWLTCCWVPAFAVYFDAEDELGVLFAFGALFGLGFFAILWFFMIVLHAMYFAKARRKDRETRGFEVVAKAAGARP